MDHLVPPRHRQRALIATLVIAVAALLALLPEKAHGQLPSTDTLTSQTVSVPGVTDTTVSVPTVSVPTVSVPSTTVPGTTVPSTTTTLPGGTGTVSTPSLTTPSATTPGTTLDGGSLLPGGGGTTNTTPTSPTSGSPGGGGTTGGGGGSTSGSGSSGGFGGGSTGGGGGNASAAGVPVAPALFGAAGSPGSGRHSGANAIGGAAGSAGAGAPLLGIPVPPGGGNAGVTPLAAILASQRSIPPVADRGVIGDIGHAITQIVDALPDWSRPIIGVLLALVLVLMVRSFIANRRARKLLRQAKTLEGDIAALQAALLADVPEQLGTLTASVAYRPADGLATGGDFYDAFGLSDGRVAIVVGDASGHGRDAISRAASVRYTLRAYLDAGLDPNAALRVAGRALESDSLDGDFATAVVAVYDPREGTLSYACAGHPPPIVTGAPHRPITASAAPPLGWGVPTGLRLTTVPMPAGSLACFFTDGLIEARIGGELVGRERLAAMVAELHPDDGAESLLDHLRRTVDASSDDMATLVLRPTTTPAPAGMQVEELEVEPPDLTTGAAERFLEACGLRKADARSVLEGTTALIEEHGAVMLRVTLADRLIVEAAPPPPRALDARPAEVPEAGPPPKITTE